jgi:hypothetical protein
MNKILLTVVSFFSLQMGSSGDYGQNVFQNKGMQKAKLSRKLPLLFIILFLLLGSFTPTFGVNRYSVTNGSWNSSSTWSTVLYGAPGASAPVAGDAVFIQSNHAITVTAPAFCTSVTFTETGSPTSGLIVNSTLTVSGVVVLNAWDQNDRSCSISGTGTLNCASVLVGTDRSPDWVRNTTMTSTIANFNVAGNLTVSSFIGSSNTLKINSFFHLESGILNVDGIITTTNENASNVSTFTMTTGAQSGVLLLSNATPFSITATGTSTVTLNGTSALVNYDGSGQTVRSTPYRNLTLSGSGTKTFGAATTVSNNLSIASGVVANLGTSTHTANTLTLEGTTALSGTWGSTTSSATNKNNIFFAPTTGILTVSATCATPLVYAMTGTGGSFCSTLTGSAIGLASSQTGVSYQLLRGNVAVGSAVAGTDGNSINFGTFNTTGNYTVLATRTPTVCTATMSGTVTILSYSSPPIPTATVTNALCPTGNTGAITITNAVAPASLSFTNTNLDSGSMTPEGSHVDFGQKLLSNRTQFTAEGWIKFDKTNIKNRMSLFGQNDVIEFGFEGNYLRCWTNGGGTVDYSLSLYPSDNAWHHIAVAGNGAKLILYIDGVQVANTNYTTSNYGSNASYNTKIGWGVMDAGGVGLTGEVFKLGFWSKALSPTEITNMASGFVEYDVSQAGLLAGYSFKEGSGLIVTGVGSVAPTGNLISAPIWKDPYVYSWTKTASAFTSNAISLTGLDPGTYNLTTSLKGCTQTGSWIVNATNTVPAITTQPTAPAATCSGAGTQSMTVVATGAGLTYIWKKGNVNVINGGVIGGQGTATLTLTNPLVGDAGSYTVVVSGTCTPAITSNPITVTVHTAVPNAPTLNGKSLTCSATSFVADWTAVANATGYRLDVATDPLFGGGFVAGYQDKVLGNVLTDNVSGLMPGVTYYVRLRAFNICGSSSNSGVITVSAPTKTWNGSWTPSGTPTNADNIVFVSPYTLTVDLAGCSCTVNTGITVTIASGKTLTITNGVTTTGGNLIFENQASLVQINDAAINMGNITYKRISAPMKDKDYTYWSSPVLGQKLNVLSPYTTYQRYYSFVNNAWFQEAVANSMIPAKGYIIRIPPVGSGTHTQAVQFVGPANNGKQTFVAEYDNKGTEIYNLIGNPYPSAISADKFLAANSVDVNAPLNGTLYFWTHNTAISNLYQYSTNDYATYNGTGAVAGSGGVSPTGKIAAGQSFFVESKKGGEVKFINDMREIGNNNQFFRMSTKSKTTAIEKNRIWLNLTNTQGLFKQMLVGYVTGATNDFDSSFDGVSFNGNTFVDFYSVSQDKNLTIQGKALPFDRQDLVPLGYSSTFSGSFSIAINNFDGLFADNPVFIEDKVTQVTHNLKNGPYTFSSDIGTFNNRFVLKYSNTTLGTGDFDKENNQVVVAVRNKEIKINSFVEAIEKVVLYDLLGKQVYEKKDVSSKELQVIHLNVAQQVLIVKITLENGVVVTKKIIF